MTVPDNEKRKNVSTFNVKTKEQCYNCGRKGHFKNDCWRQLQTSQIRGAFQSRRTFQNRGAAQSRGRGQRGSQRGYQRGNSRGRGHGRGAAQQREEDSRQPSEDSAAETWMVKVNHDEVKSEIVSDVFYSEIESKFSPCHNLGFGEDCDNKPRITNVYNYNCEKNGKFKEISWLLDSGCTDHVVNDERMYENLSY